MKKHLLCMAVLATASGAQAANYLQGDFISPQTPPTAGEHKVIIEVVTKNTAGYLHTLNATGSNIYFGAKSTEMTADSEFTEDYIYTLNVDTEGKFTIKNSTGAFCPIPTQSSTSVYMYSNTTDESQAGKLEIFERTAANNNYTDYYMLRLVNSTLSHVEMHLDGNGNSPVVCFFTTGDAGINDAGGASRTACAVKMYYAKSLAFPMQGEYYRMLNRETSSGRENSYLGYYPETPWYIFDKTTGTRTDKSTSNFVSCGNKATASASTAEIDGQLWTFIEGTDENAGKYCMVNKAFPSGAISNAIVDNNGTAIAAGGNGANPSRWLYVADRTSTPAEVMWFDLSEQTTAGNTEYVRPTFENTISPNARYMALAAAGQKQQVIRISENNENSAWWQPIRNVPFDTEATWNEGISVLKGIAEGFASMKAVIGNEEMPSTEMPENTDETNIEEAIAATNTALQNYINRFNNKLVTISNNRRLATAGQTPWLSIYIRNGQPATNTLAEVGDASKWMMTVDQNKVRFYNLTTGYQLRTNLMIPQAVNGGTRFQINGTNNYLNIDTGSSDVCDYSVANDPGSIWTLAETAYTFCQPEVSTAQAPKYYRILSDRWMSGKNSSALAINGENRATSGPGETTSRAQLGHSGQYWRLEAGDTENSVKIINLVDEYQLGGADGQPLTMHDGDGREYYLHRLAGVNCGSNGQPFTIDNTYAISKSPAMPGDDSTCVDAANDGSVKNSQWSPTRENCNNLGNNGSAWYFCPATEDEIAAATTSYIAAVNARIAIADTDNILALAGSSASQEYAQLFDTESDLSTIEGVNSAKRNTNATAITEFINNMLDNTIVGQHIQLSATKNGWNTHYLKDNGTKITGTTDDTDIATLWTISKGENGYVFTNESTGRTIAFGNDADSSDFPTSDTESYEFLMTYNVTKGKFAIHKQGTTIEARRCIHLADNNGRIVKWAASGIDNSHWYLSALADADITVDYDNSTNGYTVTVNGEFTEKAADDAVIVSISRLPEETEEDTEPAMIRKAARTATQVTSFTAGQFATERTLAIDETLEPGSYVIEAPGAMIKTTDGKHTRALYSTFKINTDGTVTGIDHIDASGNNIPAIYFDLQGRRVNNPHHGIYIINGRKVRL